MIESVWILTYEVNQYDQYGEYFERVFFEKPGRASLAQVIGVRPDSEEITQLLGKGVSRYGDETAWYYLREYEK